MQMVSIRLQANIARVRQQSQLHSTVVADISNSGGLKQNSSVTQYLCTDTVLKNQSVCTDCGEDSILMSNVGNGFAHSAFSNALLTKIKLHSCCNWHCSVLAQSCKDR